MTIRPFPLQTREAELKFPGCIRKEYEVRCWTCGRFMSSVLLVIYEENQEKESLRKKLNEAGVEIQAWAMGKCIRCKEDNAQILFTA